MGVTRYLDCFGIADGLTLIVAAEDFGNLS
jgi:hypothetical protein